MARFPDSRTSAALDAPRRPRGHRQELPDRQPERRSFQDRLQAAILDIAVLRAVASRDLVDQQFGGHRYAGRRGIDHLKNAGLVTEHDTRNPETNRNDRYLVATPAGRQLAQRIAGERALDPDQRTWNSTAKRSDLHHDLALYRAVGAARDALLKQGLHVRRYRLDAELRGHIARRSEAVRARRGPAAVAQLRQAYARHHGLALDPNGSILFPDAQIEYSPSPEAPTAGRVNIDVVTENYRAATIAAKAAAGFGLYPSGPRAAKNLKSALRSLGNIGDRGNVRGGGRRGPSEGSLLDF